MHLFLPFSWFIVNTKTNNFTNRNLQSPHCYSERIDAQLYSLTSTVQIHSMLLLTTCGLICTAYLMYCFGGRLIRSLRIIATTVSLAYLVILTRGLVRRFPDWVVILTNLANRTTSRLEEESSAITIWIQDTINPLAELFYQGWIPPMSLAIILSFCAYFAFVGFPRSTVPETNSNTDRARIAQVVRTLDSDAETHRFNSSFRRK
jgi:hypothetical protein